jgi:Family of unknown function (DUF6117)
MTQKDMTIPDHVKERFNVLERAHTNGDLCLISLSSMIDANPRYVVCAMEGDGTLIPLGEMNSSVNPYEQYIPPRLDS